MMLCMIKQRLFIFSFSNFVRLLHPWPCAFAASAESGPPLSLCSCLCWAALAWDSNMNLQDRRLNYQASVARLVSLQLGRAADNAVDHDNQEVAMSC
jgi:hypothetical protein